MGMVVLPLVAAPEIDGGTIADHVMIAPTVGDVICTAWVEKPEQMVWSASENWTVGDGYMAILAEPICPGQLEAFV